MPKVTFDTNIFIARKRVRLPDGFYFSIVVLAELVAGAADESEVRKFDASRHEFEDTGRLLVPTAEDWWQAGRIINHLQRGLKSRRRGVTPKMAADEKYRIINDVLIARTARRAGVTVVTDNAKDFETIQKFCNVRLMSGDEYFGSEN